MTSSIESETNNDESAQQWEFICRSAKNPELVAAIEGLRITDPIAFSIQFSHPADAYFLEQPNTKLVDAHVTARWLLPNSLAPSEHAHATEQSDVDEVAVCFHGFGCAHTEDHNYYSALIAALGYPALSVDLPGFNTNKQDTELFTEHHWMGDIDQYPYMILQVLEHMLHTNSIHSLKSSPTEHSPDQKPLRLNIITHSVSARSLLVAASLNDGALLKAIETKWSDQLGREVKFTLTALEPAFALQPDNAITAVDWLNWGLPRWMLKRTPEIGLAALRMFLSMLTQTYGLVNADSYPLTISLIRERLDWLLEHPSQISQAPTKSVSKIGELQKNFSTVVVVALRDSLVNNRVSAAILLKNKEATVEELTHLLVSVATKDGVSTVTVTEKPENVRKTTAVYGIHAGHVAELEHPEVMSFIIRDGHLRLHR